MDNHFHTELDEQLKAFNIRQYQYLFFDRNTCIPPVIFSTYPKEWLAIYQEQKLYHIDPIIHHAKSTIKPFAWQSVIKDIRTQDQQYFKLAKQYGIDDGYTFIVNDALGNSVFLNLLCDSKSSVDIAYFDTHCSKLQMLLIELYDLYLQEKKSVEYYRTKAYLLLSEKEIRVLVLGAKGLKYKEIALRLNISERTVKFHIQKIVEKLNVQSAKHAFLRSKELNII